MTSKAYLLPETLIEFKDSGGDAAFTCTSLAAGAGRQSAQYDFGTSARPYIFSWRAYVKFSTTPVVGEVIDVYIKTSDGTYVDNDDGTTDAALSAEDKLKNLTRIGFITVDEASTTAPMVASGVVELPDQYVQVVFFNRTADALSSTAADCGFRLKEITVQGQAT